jgi:hypothetical protein
MEPARAILERVKGKIETPAIRLLENSTHGKEILKGNFKNACNGNLEAFRDSIIHLSSNYIIYKDGALFANDSMRYAAMLRTIYEVLSTGKYEGILDQEWMLSYLLQAFYDIGDEVISKDEKIEFIRQIDEYFDQQQ